MIKPLAIICLLLTGILPVPGQRDQDLAGGYCILYSEFARKKDLYAVSELPVRFRQQIDSIISSQYPAYVAALEFNGARLYDPAVFHEAEEKRRHLAVLYSFSIPGVTDDIAYTSYCAYFSFDSTGHLLRPVELPDKKWQAMPLISQQKALGAAKKRWKDDKGEIDIELCFDTKKSCFVWKLSRPLGLLRRRSLWVRQVILINGHTGKISSKYKQYGSAC